MTARIITDPIQQRLTNIEAVLDEIESHMLVWTVLTKENNSSKPSQCQVDQCTRLLPEFDALQKSDALNMHLKYAGIQPELKAGSSLLRTVLMQSWSTVQRLREQFSHTKAHDALHLLFHLETELTTVRHSVITPLQIAIEQRRRSNLSLFLGILETMRDSFLSGQAKSVLLKNGKSPFFGTILLARRTGTPVGPRQSTCDSTVYFNPLSIDMDEVIDPWNTVACWHLIAQRAYFELQLDAECFETIVTALSSGVLSQAFCAWRGDVVAEIMSTFVGGPGYVGARISRLSGAPSTVVTQPHDSRALPACLRWRLQLETLRTMGFQSEATAYEHHLRLFYGPLEMLAFNAGGLIRDALMVCGHIVSAVAQRQFACCDNLTLTGLVQPFTQEQLHRSDLLACELSSQAGLKPQIGSCSPQEREANHQGIKEPASMSVAIAGCRTAYEVNATVPGVTLRLRETSLRMLEAVLQTLQTRQLQDTLSAGAPHDEPTGQQQQDAESALKFDSSLQNGAPN